jgi:MFS family permease
MTTFTISSVGVGFIAASYYYSYNLMQIPAGILCDKFGSKIILMIASLICILGLLLFVNSNSISEAIFSRVLMGLGASCAAVILVLISKQYFNAMWLPVLIGMAQFSGNLGSIGGQFPLSIAANMYSWRTSVLLLTIVPVGILVGAALFMKNSPQGRSKNNIQESLQKIKHVLLSKGNWLIALYAMLLWTPFYTFSSLWGIPFLRTALNLSAADASKLMAIAWIGSGVGSILIGMWSSYIKKRKICIVVSALLGVIVFPILIFAQLDTVTALSIALFIFGCSSAGQALSFALISDNNNQNELGTAVGFLNTVIMFGPMLLDPIIGWLIKVVSDGVMVNGIPVYSITNYQIAFMTIPVLFVCAAIAAFFYKEKM